MHKNAGELCMYIGVVCEYARDIQLFEEIVFSFRTVTCLKKVEITIGQNI